MHMCMHAWFWKTWNILEYKAIALCSGSNEMCECVLTYTHMYTRMHTDKKQQEAMHIQIITVHWEVVFPFSSLWHAPGLCEVFWNQTQFLLVQSEVLPWHCFQSVTVLGAVATEDSGGEPGTRYPLAAPMVCCPCVGLAEGFVTVTVKLPVCLRQPRWASQCSPWPRTCPVALNEKTGL